MRALAFSLTVLADSRLHGLNDFHGRNDQAGWRTYMRLRDWRQRAKRGITLIVWPHSHARLFLLRHWVSALTIWLPVIAGHFNIYIEYMVRSRHRKFLQQIMRET